MTPADFRNITWEGLQARVTRLRRVALEAWRIHGPGTTREVARRAGMDLLTFRPRTTELVQLGFVQLDEPGPGPRHGEGTYRALGDDEIRALFLRRVSEARETQPELSLQ